MSDNNQIGNELPFGTSAAHGFKDYEYSLRKPPGVFRIFVLGDSVAFGQGVRLDETFSKALENLLNRQSATRVYEVLNGSAPAMNAIQEYCLQKCLGAHYRPDLYLMALCHNDAELTQPADGGNYEEHLARTWDRDGETWPYFLESLRRAKRLAESQEARLVVAYVVFSSESIGPQAPGILKEVCQELDIPFTNTGDSTRPYAPESLCVNEAETHPNEKAHGIMAQHLAQFLRQQGLLPPEDSSVDEREVLCGLLGAPMDKGLRTEGLSISLQRLFDLLETKRQRPPDRKKRPNRASKRELQQALTGLSPLLRCSQIIDCLDAYDTFIRMGCIEDHTPLFLTKHTLADLTLSLYYLDLAGRRRALLPEMLHAVEGEAPAPDLESFREAEATVSAAVQQAESLVGDLNRLIESSSLPSADADGGECFLSPILADAVVRLRYCLEGPNRPFVQLLAEAHRIGLALRDAAEELSGQLDLFQRLAVGDFPDEDQFRRYQHLVSQTIRFYLLAADQLRTCLDKGNVAGLAKAARALVEGTVKSWPGRRVDLEITANIAPSDEYRGVGILWTNVIPLSAPQRDTTATYKDGQDHTYRFRFFAGGLAFFTLELSQCTDDVVRSIRMSFNGKLCREWQAEQLQALKQNRLRSELLIITEDESGDEENAVPG